jgi:hypothetical protein
VTKVGDCALCLAKQVPLMDSHYIPAGLYKVSRQPQQTNPNPILVSATTAVTTSKQASDYLLCAQCERRLNDGGEHWVISNVWRDPSTFPLRESLLAAGAVPSDPDFIVFEGATIPEVDTDKLCYFAASIFWRGAVHKWTIQNQENDRLPLGPYKEAFRLFLMGGNWPAHTALQVHVGNGMEEFRNGTTVFPYLRYHKSGFRQFCFTVPGITFFLFTGKTIPEPIRQFCSAQSSERYLFMVEEVDKGNAQRNIKLFKETKKVGSLAKRIAQPGTAAPSPWPASEVLKLLRETGK